NVLQKITNKKSKAYAKPPIRKLESEQETLRFNEILEKHGFDEAMKLIDRYKNLHRYCALGVFRTRNILDVGEYEESYNFWALAPYDFCVHRDVNDEIYAWSLPSGKDDEGEFWTIWTDQSHWKVYTK